VLDIHQKLNYLKLKAKIELSIDKIAVDCSTSMYCFKKKYAVVYCICYAFGMIILNIYDKTRYP